MITENCSEFNKMEVMKCAEKNKVLKMFSIPYFHKSNGRIERANRTIRNAFRRTKGLAKMSLTVILKNYNNKKHGAKGISPIVAEKKENFELVKSRLDYIYNIFKE